MWQECRRNLDIWWAEHGWAWPNSAGWTMRNHRYSQPFGDHSDHSIPSHPVDGSVASRIPPQTRREPLSHHESVASIHIVTVTRGHIWPFFRWLQLHRWWQSWRMSLAKQRRLRRCGWLLAQLQDVRADRCSLREPTGTQKVVMNSDEWWSNGQWIQLIQWIIQYLSIFVSFSASFCSKEISRPRARPGQSTSDSRTEKRDWKVTQVNPMIAASALRDCWWLNVINKC
jgi:hypothetical protein